MKKIVYFIIIMALIICALPLGASAQDNEKFLNKVEKQAFDYFLNETSEKTGLTLNTTEACAPATNAASGFMLSSLIVGVERGWISKEKAYSIALKTLRTFKKIENFNGFTYHYFDVGKCARTWSSEVSCIDTGLFLSGVITIGEYFNGTEVSSLADEIYRNTNWKWILNDDRALAMSWKPEGGFSGRIDSFSEGIICYILAMGSPTYPIPKECWDSFSRPVSRYNGYKMIYVADGGLFQYLFPLTWLDLRDKHDKYADYWQNAVKAIKANKKYCLDNGDSSRTYGEGFWGLSASLSPSGYRNFGAKPGRNKQDGTVAPYAVAGSIPLCPNFAITDYRSMDDRVPATRGKYGLTDAFNIDRKWAAADYISIDQGLTLLMIENYRSGLIWKYFMQNKYVKKGLELAEFVPGRQDDPSPLAEHQGNPNDTVVINSFAGSIKIDGDLSDWDKTKHAQVTLTSMGNKNTELGVGYVKDDSDLSGVFFLAYDSKNLYIAGIIKDDEIVTTKTRDKIYEDDCVEIYIDADRNGFKFDGNPYDYQLGIAPAGPDGKPQAWTWGYVQKYPSDIEYASKIIKGGYTVEVKIPFASIHGFDPKKTKSVGFSISVHDRDTNGKVKKLNWSIDTASHPGQIFFGTLTLGD